MFKNKMKNGVRDLLFEILSNSFHCQCFRKYKEVRAYAWAVTGVIDAGWDKMNEIWIFAQSHTLDRLKLVVQRLTIEGQLQLRINVMVCGIV